MSKRNTMTGTPEYNGLVKVMAEAKEQVAKAGKKAVTALLKAFFAANPDVTGIGWTQYTPHFNDGDPCEFSVRDFYWTTKPGVDFAEVTSVYPDDDSAGWQDEYGEKKTPRERTLKEAVATLRRAVDDDVFEAAFGDHAMVIAVPDGFHVSEYSHD